MIYYFLPVGAILLLLLLFFLFFLISRFRKRRRAKRYLERFSSHFEGTWQIRRAMEETALDYPKRSKERKALEAGLYYLDHSLFRDYLSALSYILDTFGGSKKIRTTISQYHVKAVEHVRENRALALSPPGEKH